MIDSGHPEQAQWALIALGELLKQQGDVGGATAAYRSDRPATPTRPCAIDNLGVLLTDQGDPEGARDAWQQVIDSGHPE